MSRNPFKQARAAARALPCAGAGRAVLAYMVLVDLAVAAILTLTLVDSSHGDWGRLALLAVLAVGFEEGSRRAARLQIRLSSQLRSDMMSVWAVAAAAALPPRDAVLLMAGALVYLYFRHQRPAGDPLYRKVFVGATSLLGCLLAGVADRAVLANVHGLSWALAGSLGVLSAIVVYTSTNRALVTGYLLLVGVRGRELLGSLHDNLIELATLCLGGLVALAVVYQPWLSVLVIAPMVTLQRGALVRELEAAAMTDTKTGLLNAVAWEQLAMRELARGEREHSPVSLLIIDVDRFKQINDRFGHLAGDVVLRSLGRTLTAAVREYDGVGRFGGEEFVAVLPDADQTAALMIAERVRSRVAEMSLEAMLEREAAGLLSVSIGVACAPVDGTELTDLLHAADGALYAAKAAGRNRVRLALRGGGSAREAVQA